MIGAKLIDVLKIFSDEQIKEFELFLNSPFYNNRSSIQKFYRYVVSFHPNYEHDFSDIKKVRKYLKNTEVDVNQVIKWFSFLFKELERYLVVVQVDSDKLLSQNLLSLYYNRKNLSTLFESELANMEINLQSQPSYHFLQFQLNENKCSFLSKHDMRKGDINYIPLSNSIDAFYYYNKLRLFCLMLNRSLVVGFDYSLHYKNFIFSKEVLDDLNIEVINIYHKIFEEFKHTFTKSKYDEIVAYLDKIENKISIDDLRIIYTILINVSKSIYPIKDVYYQKIFYLYKKQLDLGLVYYDNKIHVGYLKNIVVVALNVNELTWAELFLINHKKKIMPEEEHDESFYYLMSEVYFARKEHEHALNFLSKTKSSDILIKLAIKRMYLKIFFELREDSIFESYVGAYKVYLGRDKAVSIDKKEAEKNFVNLLLALWKCINLKQKNKIAPLIRKIETLPISDKKWLLAVANNHLE